jgi:hypothetical protein
MKFHERLIYLNFFMLLVLWICIIVGVIFVQKSGIPQMFVQVSGDIGNLADRSNTMFDQVDTMSKQVNYVTEALALS